MTTRGWQLPCPKARSSAPPQASQRPRRQACSCPWCRGRWGGFHFDSILLFVPCFTFKPELAVRDQIGVKTVDQSTERQPIAPTCAKVCHLRVRLELRKIAKEAPWCWSSWSRCSWSTRATPLSWTSCSVSTESSFGQSAPEKNHKQIASNRLKCVVDGYLWISVLNIFCSISFTFSLLIMVAVAAFPLSKLLLPTRSTRNSMFHIVYALCIICLEENWKLDQGWFDLKIRDDHTRQLQLSQQKNAKIGESVLPGLGGEEGDVDGVEASVLFLQDVFVDLIVCLWFWRFHVFFFIS